MRVPFALFVATTVVLATSANVALQSDTPELKCPLRLTATLQKSAHAAVRSKAAPQAALTAKPVSVRQEPKLFMPPAAARIGPSGMLSVNGTVEPILSTGAPITPNGILSIKISAPAIYSKPMNGATREADIAQLELTRFLNDEYPAQLRQFDCEIAVTQAEIAALQQRLANYNRFDKFINNANPLFESQQRANVALVDAQQRLSNLQY
ncbi:MAG: hypothetical protein IAF94_14520, partial [Pirellulaceae bacterium]|nr:hypothetical protein [Pirellulaceae bacterium]